MSDQTLPVRPQDDIIKIYRRNIQRLIFDNTGKIKYICFGTGSGKTYTFFKCAAETIEQNPETHIIFVYVAPLRVLLEFPERIKTDVLVMTIYGRDSLLCEEFLEKYIKWIPLIQRASFWKGRKAKDVQEAKAQLSEALKAIYQSKKFKNELKRIGLEENSENIKKFLKELQDKILNNISSFFKNLIKIEPDEQIWKEVCFACYEMATFFCPLYLLKKDSGIIMLTYDKLKTRTWVPYKSQKDDWIFRYETVERMAGEKDNTHFIFGYDELESGYEKTLNSEIFQISPNTLAINNGLSSIHREFPTIFTEYGQKNYIPLIKALDSQCTVNLNHIRSFLLKNKPFPERLKYLKAHVPAYETLRNEGNSTAHITFIAQLYRSIHATSIRVNDFYPNPEQKELQIDLQKLCRSLQLFESNRALIIDQELFNNFSIVLKNIFTHNELYIYDIEPLKKLFLHKFPSGHVAISEDKSEVNLVDVIHSIFVFSDQIKKVFSHLHNVIEYEDSQSHSFRGWSSGQTKRQKWKKESDGNDILTEYIDTSYVYESYKPQINIARIPRYSTDSVPPEDKKNLISKGNIEISIGSAYILGSPDKVIASIMKPKKCNNSVFLISATGEIEEDLTTGYDATYLKDVTRDDQGQTKLSGSSESDILLNEKIRTHRQSRRTMFTNFFDYNENSIPNKKTQPVSKRFCDHVLEDFNASVRSENVALYGRAYGLNPHKLNELKIFFRFMFYLIEDTELNNMLIFTQTVRFLKRVLSFCVANNSLDFRISQSQENSNIYFFQSNHKFYRSPIKVKIIIYEASFDKKYVENPDEIEGKKTFLEEITEEDGLKTIFISAYASAGVGLNPVVKNQQGDSKDFDSLVLLMDPFYSKMSEPQKAKKSTKTSEKEQEKSAFYRMFIQMKGALPDELRIKDFNQYLGSDKASNFAKKQDTILIGKTIIQSIGRAERRDYPGQIMKMFINEESRKKLIRFYRYISEKEIRKLSVNNFKVYQDVIQREDQRKIHNYESHESDELEAARAFLRGKNQCLEEIQEFKQAANKGNGPKKWELLRSPLAFNTPEQYLNEIKASGLFSESFVNSLFYVPQEDFDTYCKREEGCKIICDSQQEHSWEYNVEEKLNPNFIKKISVIESLFLDSSTIEISRMYHRIIPSTEVFKNRIPRPEFFFDIFYPSFSEYFTEKWIVNSIFERESWKEVETFYGYQKFPVLKKHQIYEDFDLFIQQGHTLYCIDVKAWSQVSGNQLSVDTIKKTKGKLQKIRELFPGKKVKGLLLKFVGNQIVKDLGHGLYSSVLITFDDDSFPVEYRFLRQFLDIRGF